MIVLLVLMLALVFVAGYQFGRLDPVEEDPSEGLSATTLRAIETYR